MDKVLFSLIFALSKAIIYLCKLKMKLSTMVRINKKRIPRNLFIGLRGIQSLNDFRFPLHQFTVIAPATVVVVVVLPSAAAAVVAAVVAAVSPPAAVVAAVV